MSTMYPAETLDKYEDDGTMPDNLAEFSREVVGHRIITAEQTGRGILITLDNAKRVRLSDGGDCCAYTEVNDFLLHADRIEHVITGVGTTDGFTTWHIYADMGDVLEMSVGWSCGNPFYYAYGFTITVEPDVIVLSESPSRAELETEEMDRG
ncbi:hypothetical protein PTQ19_10135 [Microbacterium esteraromaticum]|nr:hypothetical protein [Microbacterium esteraromaticum]WDH77879.1 hypothetical protein PTQ19_10135 [Microbacterium esteraromaticum]